jgi:predicted transcriptional regulator
MTHADDVILEFLLNEPVGAIRATPAVVEANIDYKKTHVNNRMIELRKAGLLEYYDQDRGIYQITDRGRAYLAGELDTEDLERDEN